VVKSYWRIIGETRKGGVRCQDKVMCGGQEIWLKAEYNRMTWNRDEHFGKIKDVAECRSGGSHDRSHMIRVLEIESVM